MKKKKMPKSIRKYIRTEKSRIRREVLSLKEQEKQTQELYKKFLPKELPPLSQIKKEELVEEKITNYQKTG